MTHWRMTSPPALGGTERLTGSRGQHYAPLPANSILAPDDPSTPEEREIVAFAWLGLLIGSFCMLLGSFYYLCVS